MTEEHHRKLERKNLVYFPEVIDSDFNEFVGRLVDVTTEGFLLIGDTPMEEGTHFNAIIKWVDEFRNESTFSCKIKVAWCKDDINPDHKAIGCHIDEISDTNKESIKRLIRKWGFPSV